MNESVYSVVAYVARYWFTFLAALIVWRAVLWLRNDSEQVSYRQRRLPDAGYIGEWVVIESTVPAIPVETTIKAPRDGWIGSARGCDVRLRSGKIPAHAARFILREEGLHLEPERAAQIRVDGEPVQKEATLRHGALLTVGGVTLQLRLFAGVLLVGEEPAEQPKPRRRGRRKAVPPAEDVTEPPSDPVPDEASAEDPYIIGSDSGLYYADDVDEMGEADDPDREYDGEE